MLRVAFRHGDTRLFARVIHAWDACDVSHCEVATAWVDELYACASASMLDGGVRAKALALTPDKWRVYEVPGDPDHVHAWMDAHKGDRYDVLGLLGFVVRPIKGWLRAWFCSEACAAMLGLPEPWRYSPRMMELYCMAVGTRIDLTWPDHLTE